MIHCVVQTPVIDGSPAGITIDESPMFTLRNIRLKTKLQFALLATWCGIMMIGAASAYITKDSLLAERKAGLANLVDAASTVLKQFHARAVAGELSDEQARSLALQAMSSMKYGGNGYVTVIDDKPVVLDSSGVAQVDRPEHA